MFIFINRLPLIGIVFRAIIDSRVQEKYLQIEPFISRKEKIIDLGAGNCLLAKLLKENGFKITPVDVASNSFVSYISPLIYDGKHLPFKNNSFDSVLLITVLHHVREPEALLAEAKRVANKIILIEEIYNNILTKYITWLIDSLFNLEFLRHPHSNKTDQEWKEVFKRVGLKLKVSKYSISLGVLQRVLYVVTSKE